MLPFVTIVAILGVSSILIAYGRGYRFDFGKTSLKPTGLISATSDPIAAQVLVDNRLRTATNNSFNIDPDWYTVRLIKEGFQPWEKRVRVQGEVVTRIDAFLFPANPSLSAITTSGVVSPVASPDGAKLAYIVPKFPAKTDGQIDRSGIWVLDLVDKPLGLNRDSRQVFQSALVDVSKATVSWSPDSKELLVKIGSASYTIPSDKLSAALTPADPLAVKERWQALADELARQKLLSLPVEIMNIATSSATSLLFSPDETKLLYEATITATLAPVIVPGLIGTNPTEEVRTITPGNVYVYDVKEDKNYWLGSSNALPRIVWFPTSKHLVLVSKSSIEAMEYDATNRVTVYAGPFSEGFVTPWTSPTKLVILTNLNPAASTVNNLYTVNLR